jgi:hypothetical protein
MSRFLSPRIKEDWLGDRLVAGGRLQDMDANEVNKLFGGLKVVDFAGARNLHSATKLR